MDSSNNKRIAEINLNMAIAQEYVQNHLSKPEQYRQTAEAAADLAQACLKYARALEGTNPGRYDPYWCLKKVIKKYAAFMMTAEIADIPLDLEIKAEKAMNWADELEEKSWADELEEKTAAGQEEKEEVTLAEAMRDKQELDKETEELLRPFFPELEDEKKEESEGANNE